MKEYYFKSLNLIKTLNIKNESDYKVLINNYLVLSLESLKYISQTRSFKKIIKLANSY